jgi:hypothetical protein
MQPSPTSQLKLAAATIIVVMLWLGGFGCSFCCATGATDACCRDAQGLSGKVSCNAISCCKPSTDVNEAAPGEAISSQGGLRSCSLLPAQLTSLSAEQRISGNLALAGDVDSPQVEPVSYAQTEPFTTPPSPRNRGATYLQCCVLLI